MLAMFTYLLETRKELLVGLSLSVLYITYYLVEVVKKPVLVCRAGRFRSVLEGLPALRARFWATPWCVEARAQTVLGSALRSLLLPRARFRRQVLRLRDGGQVALDWLDAPGGAGAARPVLLVLPGLTGGAHADYVRCLARAARRLGAHAVVFNNRGCGGLPLTTPRLYCALSHEDLAEVVAAVAPAGAPLLAAAARVAAALAVSPPLDVVRGSACMERAGLNALLSRHMARNLRRTVAAAGLALGAARGARSVREFDAGFTTRHFGFGSVDAYYEAATLRDKLGAVAVPLLCLCAADDPFQPERVLPRREAERSARVALAVPARGGHIGFLEGWWPAREDQYIARLAEQYFAALLAEPELLHRPPPEPDAEPAPLAPTTVAAE
ncbi:hypothetical protein MSG28_010566 [Choristoneura fumiferana]|uniref:Uncharacterized protein n=1 Tax=Choristoneura fumiferana TaxID=7141 RepID=A0ACC0KMX4_CHOFU|nr:hypothetical protein MSG28_010566 [Choristoneura fumiferana]